MSSTVRSDSSPRISIGMPVFNGEQRLEEAVQSLRAQTVADFELIISDNASTDGTQGICARLAAEDPRIHYYRNARNIGANHNYLAVLRRARADYFKWASSNDVCDSRFLERCIAALEAEPAAVLAHPRTMLFSSGLEDAAPYDGDIAAMQESAAARFAHVLANIALNNAMNGVIRTSMLRRTSGMGSFRAADTVMIAELALLGKLILLPERLFFRNMSKESATALRARADVDRHFEPEAASPLRWQHWKFHARALSGAMRLAPAGERTNAVARALRSIVWARSQLASDLVAAVRAVHHHGT